MITLLLKLPCLRNIEIKNYTIMFLYTIKKKIILTIYIKNLNSINLSFCQYRLLIHFRFSIFIKYLLIDISGLYKYDIPKQPCRNIFSPNWIYRILLCLIKYVPSSKKYLVSRGTGVYGNADKNSLFGRLVFARYHCFLF